MRLLWGGDTARLVVRSHRGVEHNLAHDAKEFLALSEEMDGAEPRFDHCIWLFGPPECTLLNAGTLDIRINEWVDAWLQEQARVLSVSDTNSRAALLINVYASTSSILTKAIGVSPGAVSLTPAKNGADYMAQCVLVSALIDSFAPDVRSLLAELQLRAPSSSKASSTPRLPDHVKSWVEQTLLVQRKGHDTSDSALSVVSEPTVSSASRANAATLAQLHSEQEAMEKYATRLARELESLRKQLANTKSNSKAQTAKTEELSKRLEDANRRTQHFEAQAASVVVEKDNLVRALRSTEISNAESMLQLSALRDANETLTLETQRLLNELSKVSADPPKMAVEGREDLKREIEALKLENSSLIDKLAEQTRNFSTEDVSVSSKLTEENRQLLERLHTTQEALELLEASTSDIRLAAHHSTTTLDNARRTITRLLRAI